MGRAEVMRERVWVRFSTRVLVRVGERGRCISESWDWAEEEDMV